MRLVLVQHLGDEPVWHVRCDMPGNYHTLCCLGLDDGAQDLELPRSTWRAC